MINRTATLLLSALFALGSVVDAQTSQPARVTDAQVAGIDASIRAQMRALGDSAVARGLPADVILSAAAEAKVKKRPPADALRAAQSRLRNWTEVQGALGAGAKFPDIKAGVDALAAGVEVEALGAISAQRRGNTPLFSSFSVLADLVTINVPIDTAIRVVGRMAVAGVREGDLTSYRKAVQSDIALGGIPSVAATTRVEGIITATSGGAANADFDYVRARATGRPKVPPEEN